MTPEEGQAPVYHQSIPLASDYPLHESLSQAAPASSGQGAYDADFRAPLQHGFSVQPTALLHPRAGIAGLMDPSPPEVPFQTWQHTGPLGLPTGLKPEPEQLAGSSFPRSVAPWPVAPIRPQPASPSPASFGQAVMKPMSWPYCLPQGGVVAGQAALPSRGPAFNPWATLSTEHPSAAHQNGALAGAMAYPIPSAVSRQAADSHAASFPPGRNGSQTRFQTYDESSHPAERALGLHSLGALSQQWNGADAGVGGGGGGVPEPAQDPWFRSASPAGRGPRDFRLGIPPPVWTTASAAAPERPGPKPAVAGPPAPPQPRKPRVQSVEAAVRAVMVRTSSLQYRVWL